MLSGNSSRVNMLELLCYQHVSEVVQTCLVFMFTHKQPVFMQFFSELPEKSLHTFTELTNHSLGTTNVD